MEAHHFDPTTGEDEFALEQRVPDPPSRHGAARHPPAPAKPSQRRPNPADPSTWGKVQRNALCPCGSGKKYKHCHGTFS